MKLLNKRSGIQCFLGTGYTSFTHQYGGSSIIIIILKNEDKGALGVIVDEVCEVVNLSEDQIENNNINSNHVKDTFINGIGTSGDQLISLFEINAIVDEKDNT